MNESRVLKTAGGDRDGFATASQHIGDELLGHHKFIARDPIVKQQQPAAESFLERMHSIASGGQRNLRNQAFRVAQQNALKRAAARELFSQNSRVHSLSVAGDSDDRAIGGGISSQEK